ncbi:hypothetical protein [Mucilaginibacter aquatilis]|uniref:hypothetical protein n=1 Tax=Mucilaginibacter aquatilis TaxID=1517760 RepID=UPI0018DC4D58|nr:hypothetical protein [Mucilaginibacter aquatilis]
MPVNNLKGFFYKALVAVCFLSSCDKDADPEVIKVSSTTIAGGGGTTNPGGGTTNPGGGTTNPGGGTTNPGGGTTNPGGGTTNPGGGTTNPGGGTTNPGGGTTNPGGGTTTNPGTISGSGDGGVAIGGEGTIVFSLKGKTYTLTSSSSYLLNGISASTFGFSLTTIGGTAANGKGILFLLGSMADATGITDALNASIVFEDGTSYTIGGEGKINFNTFSLNQTKLTSKGTFDVIMVNDADKSDKIKVGGSFNVK